MSRILVHGDQKCKGQNRIEGHNEPKRKIGDIKKVFPLIDYDEGENDAQN